MIERFPFLLTTISILVVSGFIFGACSVQGDDFDGIGTLTEDDFEDISGFDSSQEADIKYSEPEKVCLDDLEQAEISSTWSKEVGGSDAFSFSIADDGQLVAAGYSEPFSGYRMKVLDSEGEIFWDFSIDNKQYVSGDVRILDRSEVVIGTALYRSDGSGNLYLWDGEDENNLKVPLEGSACFGFCHHTEAVMVLDREQEELTLVDSTTGNVQGSKDVDGEASGEFIGDTGYILLQTEDEIAIVDRKMNVLWHQNLKFDFRGDVEVGQNGQRIAVTTVDPDHVLYIFDESVDLLWKYLLFPGGNNELLLCDENSRLIVYNVGTNGGIFMMSMESGEPIWRYFFCGSQDESIRIRDTVLTDDGRVVAHMTSSTPDSSRVNNHLVFFSSEGEIIGQTLLGVNVNVRLADAGNVAVVASGEVDEETGARVLDTLNYYRLDNSSEAPSALKIQ